MVDRSIKNRVPFGDATALLVWQSVAPAFGCRTRRYGYGFGVGDKSIFDFIHCDAVRVRDIGGKYLLRHDAPLVARLGSGSAYLRYQFKRPSFRHQGHLFNGIAI